MTAIEIDEFIERMEEYGDVWDAEDVARVYGDKTLENALDDRIGSLTIGGNIINTLLNL